MSLEDIVFYGSLVACMSLGNYYKMIDDPEKRRNYGAGLGLMIACLICGHKFYHTIFMVWGNIIIIKCCDKRYLHLISFTYTWMYLMYLYFDANGTQYTIWFHQTQALRLVGLAFEVCNANKVKTDAAKATNPSNKVSNVADADVITTEPTSVDIIAYAYFFIGLHRGPYYRWKIFKDHFNTPFAILGDCRVITEQKLKKVCAFCLGYWLLSLKYTNQVYYDDDFYMTHGTDFRYLYNIPLLLMYFLKWQILMLLCTSVCTETGFGVYPAKCQPIPGHGPSVNMELLNLATGSSSVALDQEYNFSMLKCFDNEKLLIGPKMTDTLRGWDMPTRYWFWTYIHQSFLKQQKEVRSATSFLAWMCWKGPSVPQIIMGITLWIFVRLETEYCELYETNRTSMKVPWDIGYSIMRMFCLIYLTPCLLVEDTYILFRYYNSIYWIYHIVLLILILLSIVVYKSKTSNG